MAITRYVNAFLSSFSVSTSLDLAFNRSSCREINSCAASIIACLVDLSLITSGLVEVIEADMGVIEADLSDQQYIDQELNRDEESPLLISM